MRTYASTPGRFRLSFLTWARCFPGRVATTLLPALFLAGLAVLLHFTSGVALGQSPLPWFVIAFTLSGFLREISYLRRKCSEGDINPAVVVSVRPCLIAVSANMGKRAGDAWPVIKIMPQPMGRTQGPGLRVGDRLPTVALYQNLGASAWWADFYPTAIACLTDDPDAVREAMRRLEVNEFGPDHWERLQQNLALVPQPYSPGLYWMRQR